jgi:hypothetical protein
MALTGINIFETKRFISKLEKDKENPTVFHLGLLDPILRAEFEDESLIFEKSSSNPNDPAKATIARSGFNIKVVRFGLKGMDNFLDPRTNKPVPFETVSVSIKGKNYNIASEQIVKMLGKKLTEELAEEILSENIFSEEEEKNL